MSNWKLVEAEAISTSNGNQQNHQQNNYPAQDRNVNQGNGGRRQSRERRRSGGGRRQRDQETAESRQYYAHLAVQTLEYYFSPDSLISDTTIRSYLDEAGYIPIAFVCNFPEILAIGAYYEDIVVALQNSSLFEVDVENETMRLHDWQKWLMPNGLGGFGLPRYCKQPSGYNAEDYYAPAPGEEGQLYVDATEPPHPYSSGDQELSPNASEYKPKAST